MYSNNIRDYVVQSLQNEVIDQTSEKTAFQGQEVVKEHVKSLHQKSSFVLCLYRTYSMTVLNQRRQNNEISSPIYLWENFVWQE